jgi:hypothetical protein
MFHDLRRCVRLTAVTWGKHGAGQEPWCWRGLQRGGRARQGCAAAGPWRRPECQPRPVAGAACPCRACGSSRVSGLAGQDSLDRSAKLSQVGNSPLLPTDARTRTTNSVSSPKMRKHDHLHMFPDKGEGVVHAAFPSCSKGALQPSRQLRLRPARTSQPLGSWRRLFMVTSRTCCTAGTSQCRRTVVASASGVQFFSSAEEVLIRQGDGAREPDSTRMAGGSGQTACL